MADVKTEPFLCYSYLSQATYYWIDGSNKLRVSGKYTIASYPFHDPGFSASTPLIFENRRALKRFVSMQKHISAYHRAVIDSASTAAWESSVLVLSHLLSRHCGYDVESTSSAQGMALAVLGIESSNPYDCMVDLMEWISSSFALQYHENDGRFVTARPAHRGLQEEIYATVNAIVKRAWLDRMLKPQISSIGHSTNLRLTEDNIADWDQIRQLHELSRMNVTQEGNSALLEALPHGAYRILNQPRSLNEATPLICVLLNTNASFRTSIINKRLNSDEIVEVRLRDSISCNVGDLIIASPIPTHIHSQRRSDSEDNRVDTTVPVTPKIRLLLSARKNQ
jgi:hypothetical protein